MSDLDVLVTTCRRPTALAVTLAGLAGQTLRHFRVVVSDQTEDADVFEVPEVRSIAQVLAVTGREVETHRHLPRRGLAEHRDFLFRASQAPYALFLDDDVYLEPDLLERMLDTIREQRCGLVGCGLIGPGFADDVRPHEQQVEFWAERVRPESIRKGSAAWGRYVLHNAANLFHLQRRLGLEPGSRHPYKIAWVGGCVLYDAEKLRDAGGFGFWRELPPDHVGEDVVAQQRVMALHGGCGLLPSGAYHLQLPTTAPHGASDAPDLLPTVPDAEDAASPRVPSA